MNNVVELLDKIFHAAISAAASDAHIEPQQESGVVRFRVDGVLTTQQRLPNSIIKQIISRLKILAKLDITETRLPQDGSIQYDTAGTDRRYGYGTEEHAYGTYGAAGVDSVEIRLSTCPTIFGEKIALRFLNATATRINLAATGLEATQDKILRNYINKPQGLVLITGPTGSGKTSLLYAILAELDSNNLNIITIEDPVEIVLPNINQISLNTKIGVNFSTILKTVLRQDPNVIMIGEIRDAETAELAIKAAQTGHLVLATLHTTSAISTLARLKLLGVAQQEVLETVNLIINQRLVRKLCIVCNLFTAYSVHNKQDACKSCNNGYKGRIGVFELLTKAQLYNFYKLDAKGIYLTYKKIFKHYSLKDALLTKIKQRITSMAELRRVL